MSDPDVQQQPLLRVEKLTTQFVGEQGQVRAVDGVSFDLQRGEMLGVVGESGCGKSVTACSILQLLPKPQGRITSGRVFFEGRSIESLPEREMRKIRGRRIAMIFQDPMTSLNPYLTVGQQLAEVGQLHLGLTRREAWRRGVALLERVSIPEPGRRAEQFPHELSGGMRQRVMIAMALLCEPSLLIADEPTTALDVTIQAQILELLVDLQKERGLSVLLITHDLAVVRNTCDRVVVMYAGRIVESASSEALFQQPHHPYTQALLKSVPRLDTPSRQPLLALAGLPPRLSAKRFEQCAFAPRCFRQEAGCLEGEPTLRETAPGRLSRCLFPPSQVEGTS